MINPDYDIDNKMAAIAGQDDCKPKEFNESCIFFFIWYYSNIHNLKEELKTSSSMIERVFLSNTGLQFS